MRKQISSILYNDLEEILKLAVMEQVHCVLIGSLHLSLSWLKVGFSTENAILYTGQDAEFVIEK